MVEMLGDPNEESQDEDEHDSKKLKQSKAEGRAQKPATCSRLTERKLACARLVSAHKYECKKILDQICDRQAKWRAQLAVAENPKLEESILEPVCLVPEGDPNEIMPERTHNPWKQAEREALKKCFLSFGFGRWQEIETAMKANLKIVKHGRGDMQDACWQFVSELLEHVSGKEEAYLRQQLSSVDHRGSIKTPGVPWTKVEGSAKIWVRRLQLLDSITTIADEIENPESKDIFESALMSMSGTNAPAQWWNAKTDLALIRGIHKHGYGNYEAVKTDREFSWAFSDVNQKLLDNPTREKIDAYEHPRPPPQWPATDILTKRLKRVTDHLMRTGQLGRNEISKPSLWSRKDSMEMVKVLMTHGMPNTSLDHFESPHKICIDWEFLANRSNLTNHPTSTIRDLCEAIVQEAWECIKDSGEESGVQSERGLSAKEKRKRAREVDSQNCFGGQNALVCQKDDSTQRGSKDEGNIDVCVATSDEQAKQESNSKQSKVLNKQVLTPVSAARLRERLSMFQTLHQGLPLIKDRALKGNLSSRTVDLPEWWVAGIHDFELGVGVLKHGIGAWSSIEADSSLSFTACSQLFERTGEKLPMLCGSNPVEEANRLLAGSNITRCEASPSSETCCPLPDGSILMKRLKHIISQLRRVFKLMPLLACPNSNETSTTNTNVSPPSKTSGNGRAAVSSQQNRSKKCKYSKKIMVKRDKCGKAILPLTLTNMLTLLELGTIEWERISFHSERHIYPIGFNTRRRFSSTVDPLGSTMYTCTIVDGGSRPVFKVTAEDNKALLIRNDTPSGSWVELFCLVNKVRGIKKDKVTISGTDMFGLSHPIVSQLIQELPNATRCMYFLPELSFCPPPTSQKTSDLKAAVESTSQISVPNISSIGEADAAPASQWNSTISNSHNHFPLLSAGGADSWDGTSQVPIESIHSMRNPIYRGRDMGMHRSSHHYQHPSGVTEMGNGEDSLAMHSSSIGSRKSTGMPLEAPTLVQVVATGGRSGIDGHRQKQVHAGTSMCGTDRQVRLLEVLPQLRHEPANALQVRRQSTQFGVPMKVYTQHATASVGFSSEDHVGHSLPDSGRSHVVVPSPACQDYQSPPFALPSLRSGPQRFHVMATDNLGIGAGTYQAMKPPRDINMPLHSGLHTHWPGQLLPGRQVALCIPNFTDRPNSLQAPKTLRDRPGDDHLPDA